MSSSASSWRKSRANSILRNAGGRAKSVPFGFPCPFFQTSANPLRQGMIASADAQTNVAIKVKKQIPPKVAVPKGSRGRPESPPCRARRREIPALRKQSTPVVATEGFQRAIADFACFHRPLVASAEAIPLHDNAILSENENRKKEVRE